MFIGNSCFRFSSIQETKGHCGKQVPNGRCTQVITCLPDILFGGVPFLGEPLLPKKHPLLLPNNACKVIIDNINFIKIRTCGMIANEYPLEANNIKVTIYIYIFHCAAFNNKQNLYHIVSFKFELYYQCMHHCVQYNEQLLD